MNNRLLIIDGHNYLYRAYFGVPQAATSASGMPVNAVFGFLAFLRKTLNFINPKFLIVVFDSEKGVEKKQALNSEYKANRDYSDKGMFNQLTFIKDILTLANVNIIECPEYEADDIIGSISNYFSKKGNDIYISSNDFDFMQLIRSNVYVVRQVKGELLLFDAIEVEKKFGIIPEQYLDYLALKGDKSDNIHGIPGIGDKTAKKLIITYNTIENILTKLNHLNDNLKRSIVCSSNKLLLNKKFLKIDSNIDIQTILNNNSLNYDSEILNSKAITLLKKIGVN